MKLLQLNLATMSVILVAFVTCLVGLAVPVFAQEPPPDDATCLMCHEGRDVSLRPSVHRLSSETNSTHPTIACVSCHTGGATHVENPSKETIGNPARMSGSDALSLCSTCHVPHPEMTNYGKNAHNLQEYNCSTCHTLHGGKGALLRDERALFCLECHQETKMQFMRRSAHPVRQQNVTCLSCHKFVQRQDHPQAYALNRVCDDCHGDITGPYPYEHEAVNGFSSEGNGCEDCHNPHGSENDKLLRQPMNDMCRQCHTVPGHAVAHDGAFRSYNCVTCHTDVHGSYQNRFLLDPDLLSRIPSAAVGGTCICHGITGEPGGTK